MFSLQNQGLRVKFEPYHAAETVCSINASFHAPTPNIIPLVRVLHCIILLVEIIRSN